MQQNFIQKVSIMKLIKRERYRFRKKVELIIQGLGNKENIKVVTNCFSRLRVQLVDTTKINEEILNQTECSGIVKTKDGVQIIYGLSVPKIKIAVNKKLNLDNSEE